MTALGYRAEAQRHGPARTADSWVPLTQPPLHLGFATPGTPDAIRMRSNHQHNTHDAYDPERSLQELASDVLRLYTTVRVLLGHGEPRCPVQLVCASLMATAAAAGLSQPAQRPPAPPPGAGLCRRAAAHPALPLQPRRAICGQPDCRPPPLRRGAAVLRSTQVGGWCGLWGPCPGSAPAIRQLLASSACSRWAHPPHSPLAALPSPSHPTTTQPTPTPHQH